MKRRSEHLVEKRDGRTEFLRATKLARTIHLALHSVGVDEDWRALELANVVLLALRQKRSPRTDSGEAVVLTTAELSDTVQHLLVVTGQPAAAVAYGAVAAERTRRRTSLALLGRLPGSLATSLAGSASAAPMVHDATPDAVRMRRTTPE